MTDNLEQKIREIYVDGMFELVRTYDISPIPRDYIDGLEYMLDKIDPLIPSPPEAEESARNTFHNFNPTIDEEGL